jgi:hypothetical protein
VAAWELVQAERDAQRHAFTELEGQLDRVVRAALQAGDGDCTVIVGSGPHRQRTRGLALTDRRVLLVDRKRDGRLIVQAAWSREGVRVASFREREETFELSIEKRGGRFRLVVPYRERERAQAVVDALGGYPAGRHRSLFWVWALCPVLHVVAWLHAAIVTRRIRYLSFAIVYAVPIVVGLMIQSAHPKSDSPGGWYVISWWVCAMHLASGGGARVSEETWLRHGKRRTGEEPCAGDAVEGRVHRHQNFEDTVADNLADGERLIGSVPHVSLGRSFRLEHGLGNMDWTAANDAIVLTNRRVLVIRLRRRVFTIMTSVPRAGAQVTEYEPRRRSGESVTDHVVIQASETTVKLSFDSSMHERGAELIAALGGLMGHTGVT